MLGNRIVPTQNEGKISNQTGCTPRKNSADSHAGLKRAVALLFSSVVLLTVSLRAQSTDAPQPLVNPEVKSPVTLKLPVAHAHFGSWCVGYLTISPDGVRYDAVRSHGKDQHSFQLKRDQVQFLNYWVLAGQPMNNVEIRTANKSYHFWLMQSEADLQTSFWRSVAAAPSDSLLLALYYWRVTGNVLTLTEVNTALAQARAQAANPAMASTSAAGTGTINGDAWKKVNDNMFINNVTSNVTTHTMTSISHMSHW